MKKKDNPSLNLQTNLKNAMLSSTVKGRAQKKMSKRRKATLRSDGRWQVYADVDGRRKACYGRTEYQANCKADILEADEETKKELEDINRKYIFENCFYRYRNYELFYGVIEPQTVDRYEATYMKYFPKSRLVIKDIRKISGKDIADFIVGILNEYDRITNKEYQRIRHIIKAVMNFVYDEELDEVQPPVIDWERIRRRLPKGKIYNNVKREYAVSDNNKMVLRNKVLNENVYPEKFAHILMLLINFSLGLRVGELAALTVDDIDMERHIVYINKSCKRYYARDEYGNKLTKCIYDVGTTKTPKGIREVPMSETVQYLFDILLKYRREKGYQSKYLAYDGERGKARVAVLSKTLNKLCRKCGMEEFNTHIIRKSFASALSKCPDIDIATISEYMGHAQVSTTLNNYIIPENETTDARIKQMSGYV